jgi:hypothetical protein
MLKKLLSLVLAGTAALLLVVLPSSNDADTSDSTKIIGNNGFAGYWDRFGVSHPSIHHIVTCEPQNSGYYTSRQPCFYGPGDWSLDYYNASETPVMYNASASSGTLMAQVWAIQPTCSGGGSVAGWTVFVDVYVSGSWEGWISYSHLDQVGVSAGQWISSGQLLGKLKRWSYRAGCWGVRTENGVHMHIEMYNKYKYACYLAFQSGVYLSYPKALGVIGQTIYTKKRSQCLYM